MAELVHSNLQSIGAPRFTQEDQDFAKRLQKAYNAPETGLDTKITAPHGGTGPVSDNSEYSWFAPMSMLNIAISPPGITAHSWGFAASAGSSIGKKALDVVGKVNACAALEIITRPEIMDEAKKEMREYLSEKKYLDLIPKTTKPKLTINQEIMDRYRPLQEKLYKGKLNCY
jgi:aminobenzoyl-glutamate utilization protein B